MSYQNHPQKFPFDNSSPQGQQQAPLYKQAYYTQQPQIYGVEQQQFPSLNFNGYGFYGQPQMPLYNIPPQQPTPVDSLTSNSISLSDLDDKKKKKIKPEKQKKDKKKKRKRGSSSGSSSSDSHKSSSKSGSKFERKKKPFYLHNDDNWKCKYCYNINFPHRQECNRCKKSRESSRYYDDKGKRYVPNPDDWKCNLCGNFNYARRDRCNRCREEKPKATQPQQSSFNN